VRTFEWRKAAGKVRLPGRSLHSWVTKTQRRDALAFNVSRLQPDWNLLGFGRVEKLVDSKMVATVKNYIPIV
jgi:hypothetical protein